MELHVPLILQTTYRVALSLILISLILFPPSTSSVITLKQ